MASNQKPAASPDQPGTTPLFPLPWQWISRADIGAFLALIGVAFALFGSWWLLDPQADDWQDADYIYHYFEPSGTWLAAKFFLSIAFPLLVYLFYLPQAARSVPLNFAWAGFGISLLYAGFLAESGERFTDGNFLWGAQVMLFLLFFVSMIFALGRDHSSEFSLRRVMLTLVFFLHLFSGSVYYLRVFAGGVYGFVYLVNSLHS